MIDYAPKKRSSHRIQRRTYSAAAISTLLSNWTTVPITAIQLIRQNLRVLRARSRDQCANNDYAKRFLGMTKTHVIGPDGFRFQARTKRADGTQDKPENDALELAWQRWGERQNCDAAQRQSITDLMQLWITTIAMDGELILRHRYGSRYGDYQYSIQTIDPERLDVSYNEDLRNGNIIRTGIEFDSDDRPVAYYFKSSTTDYYASDQNYVRIDASEIIHAFLIERIGQPRGLPWLATPLERMNMLSGYEDAALTNARVGATTSGIITSPDGQGFIPDAKTAFDEPIMDAEPGTWRQMPAGTELQAFDPAYPNGEFGTFVKASLRGIAAGLGVSYFKLANDLEGVNYSSGKLGEFEDREVWKALQNWFVKAIITPIYRDWLSLQLRMETIQINGRPLRQDLFEKYIDVRWQGRRWQGLEPLKEASSDKLKIDNYLTSTQRVLIDAGYDPEEIIEDQKRWREMLTEAGLPIPGDVPEEMNDDNGTDEAAVSNSND